VRNVLVQLNVKNLLTSQMSLRCPVALLHGVSQQAQKCKKKGTCDYVELPHHLRLLLQVRKAYEA